MKQARAFEAVHGVAAIPPSDASGFGLSGEDAAWVNRRQTPQPLAVYLGDVNSASLQFDEAKLALQTRTFIDCVAPAYPTMAVSRQRVRAQAGWHVVEIQTGHDAMVSHPQLLADALLRCAD